jgi:SAM-dependent methyltransferase
MHGYIHGYTDTETERLSSQARTLADLLHHDTVFPAGSAVLEVGCGTGAQTVFLSRQNPQSRITSIDISPQSLNKARERIAREQITNVVFQEADVFHLPFENDGLTSVNCLCSNTWAHLWIPWSITGGSSSPSAPLRPLKATKFPRSIILRVRPPRSHRMPGLAAGRAGGNAMMGRELYPLLMRAGFMDIRVSPRMVYVDASRPEFVEGFTKNTFTTMIERIRDKALQAGIIDPAEFDAGVRDLYRTAADDGVFCYTFFKAVGVMPPVSGRGRMTMHGS